MIESGSHAAGIQAADFHLPRGTALRIERPAQSLRALLPSYSVHDSEAASWSGYSSWLMPSWAKLWVTLTPDPIAVAIGNLKYARLGSAVLFGVTSRAMPVSTHGGVSVTVDIGPCAWARLFTPSAELLRDRITPLDELLPLGWTEDLVTRLAGCDRGLQVKGVLDDYFQQRMPPPNPAEPLITKITALLVDEKTDNLVDAAKQTGIDSRTLLKVTKRYFGFPPKTLLMRSRFLRALTAMLVRDDTGDFAAVPDGYYDSSHFLRGGERFLGMTPRRFIGAAKPYMIASLRARMMVIGAATPSLDKAPTDSVKNICVA